jgi:DNA-binding XRE family transcriptional regulator
VRGMRSNAAALRARRERAGHTCVSLGRASDVSPQRVWDLEQADVGVRPPTAARLAATLGCEVDDIAHLDQPAVTS